MAFTGAAVFTKISDRLVRVTGLSLALGASGTIGLFGDATADENLPDDFNPIPQGDLTLSDSIDCTAKFTAAGAGTPNLSISKAEGPFQITIDNNDGANATADLEIYVRWH